MSLDNKAENTNSLAREIASGFQLINPVRKETANLVDKLVDEAVENDLALRAIDDLKDAFAGLSYTDYRQLEGALQSARNSGLLNLEPDTNSMSPNLSSIYKILHSLRSRVDIPTLATNTIELLRMSFPLGKNVVNVNLDEEFGPLSLDASKPSTVTNGKLKVEMTPQGGQIVLSVQGCGTHTLHEGEGVILGRNHVVSRLFATDLHQEIKLPVTLPFPPNETSVSRAGILIFRSQGRVFIFDRAAMSPVTAVQGDFRIHYDPTVTDKDGNRGGSIRF